MTTRLKKGLENGGGINQGELPMSGGARDVEKERWWWIGGTDGFA